MSERIESLLAQMTLEEKVSMLAGASVWYTVPVERLGIPAIKMTDGPNGARGETQIGGPAGRTSACFPVGIALAATWNIELAERVGRALAEEARFKGAHILLAPTVNIHRSPLAGRNFECYSEDPYLTSRLAVAYIRGVQSMKVAATIKHFVCNDSEFQRQSISSEVAERPLREIYLPPFRAAVQEAGVWALMSSYNRVNGAYASDSRWLLTDLLKKEWGFDGIVMSDWGGTYSTVPAANAGLDIEMPGPAHWRGDRLKQAVEAGEVDVAMIDDAVRRILRTIERVGAFENPEIPAEQSIDKPEHRALAREVEAEAIVLLKNEAGTLPLDLSAISTIAVIGPNAKAARIMGGGSSQVNPHYAVSPYEGIVRRVGAAADILYEQGSSNERRIGLVDLNRLTPTAPGAEHGLTAQYWDNADFNGEPVLVQPVVSTQQIWYGENPLRAPKMSARFSATYTAPVSGTYGFSLTNAGRCRLFVNGELAIDHWEKRSDDTALFGPGDNIVQFEKELSADQSVELTIEYVYPEESMMGGFRLGCVEPGQVPSLGRAVELASKADVALIFAGLSSEWDSEGFDRPDMELPGGQVELIKAVAAVNPRTVVVLNTGSAIRMPWLDDVAAVVQAWYGGQELGNAVADVLFGDVNPCGKLTQTFPVRLEDNPAFINYPGENGKVHYGEGLFVGYRYYEKKKIAPLFPFGFGLSYTTFEYSNLRLSASEMAPDGRLQVSIDVANTGQRAGKEIVQLYVRDPESRLVRPEKELKGFAKVMLAPGETKTVTLTLDRESLAYWDDASKTWVAEEGQFEVLVGASSQDIRARASFTLTATSRFGGPGAEAVRLDSRAPLRDLMEDARIRALLAEHFPGLLESPQVGMAEGFSLAQLGSFAPDIFTDERLRAFDEAVAALD